MISVVMPLYNKALTINKAVDSVLAQTITDLQCKLIRLVFSRLIATDYWLLFKIFVTFQVLIKYKSISGI